MRYVLRFLLPLMLAVASPAIAQLRWVPFNNGIDGATVREMLFTRNGDLLAATSIGLYRSGDGGAHWSLADSSVFGSLFHGAHGMILARSGAGLLGSDDQGASWHLLLSGRDIGAVAVDSANGYIFVNTPGAFLYSRDDGQSWDSTTTPPMESLTGLAVGAEGVLYAGGSDGVRRSSDHGMHWDTSGFSAYVSGILTNPAGDIFLMSFDGIHRSTDGGTHWSRVSQLRVHTMRADRKGDLFAASLDANVYRQDSNGLYRSTDNGITWVRLSSHDFLAFWLSLAGDMMGIVDGWVSRSTDQGVTWLRRDEGLKNIGVMSMAIDSLGRIYALVPTSGRVSRSGYFPYYGLYRSLDHGEHWSLVKDSLGSAPLIAGRDGAIYAGVEDLSRFPDWDYIYPGMIRSADGGMTWEAIGSGLAVASLTGPGALMVGFANIGLTVGGSVTYSFDDGRSWKRSGFNLNVRAVAATSRGELLVAARYDDDTGSRDYTLYRSSDSGATWSASADSLPITGLAAGTRGEVYATVGENGEYVGGTVYRSTDGGATWSSAGDGIFANPIVVDPMGNVFAREGRRASRSTDGGESWRAIGGAPFAFLGDRMLSLDSDGIYLSRDGGTTNTFLIPAMVGDEVRFNAIVADAEGYLFAGSYAHGIFRTSGTASAPPSGRHPAGTLVLGSSIPNPATLRAAIPFTMTSAGRARLVLHDLLGGPIATLVDAQMAAGEHAVEVDLSGLVPGAYIYRLTVGGEARSGVMVVR